ncbi:TraB/VirB10 family protein [Janthinobacterium sp. PSPC3-1]|uniref:TraB/VirB10 family protein n=1 Tax=Janthinobacterium sp. PSPC3-1 TaxID=2804653 RepID=UPI003CF5D71C
MRALQRCKQLVAKWTPKQQQYLAASAIFAACIGVLWAVLAYSDSGNPKRTVARSDGKRTAVNVDASNMMVPGEIAAVDQWVGNAGKKLAQYESDKEAQERVNQERKAFEATLLKRFGELEAKFGTPPASTQPAVPPPAPAVTTSSPADLAAPPDTTQYPPGTPPSVPPSASAGRAPVAAATPTARPPMQEEVPAAAPMIHVSLASSPAATVAGTGTDNQAVAPRAAQVATLDDFVPVGILPGELLGGLDAPTGGQAQNNPLPALIKVAADAILPNRYRAGVKECFIIASGYGDISAERAYLRTGLLSCVRHDRSVLEVKIEGNVFGEDGKLGLRGTLVSKQGQLLANALRAGIVSGIGQGFSQGASTFTSSPFGTLSTTSAGTAEQMRRGIGGGVGQALNNLSNYYIRLAEQTFPVIEVHAGRKVDVVLTKGMRIPAAPPATGEEGDTAPDGVEALDWSISDDDTH